jgi:hypothetical protein
MNPEIAARWASNLLGEQLTPHDFYSICDVILKKVTPHGVNFRLIGEVWPDDAQYMLVTQSAKFDGYKGMDSSAIPQFEEGEREGRARFLLKQAGASSSVLNLNVSDTSSGVCDFEFKTILRD